MGTNVIARSVPSQKSVTLLELESLPETGCARCRFGRFFVSPMMVSELAQPLTPVNIGEALHSLLTIDLLVEGMTAAAPLRVPKQTFNTLLTSCVGLPFTEVELTPQVSIPRPWIVSATKKLNDFQQWAPNWDDGSALAFSTETLDTAREILKKIWDFVTRREIRTRPNIAPLEDGSIRFEWVNGDKELFLTILGTSVEAQKWYPLDAVESEYRVISLSDVDHELEWLAA